MTDSLQEGRLRVGKDARVTFVSSRVGAHTILSRLLGVENDVQDPE